MSNDRRYRVLLVDDERLVRFTISSYLKRSNFEVTEAASPAEAMNFVKRNHYDAIISDVSMGDVDGFVFRDMVRQFDTGVPVIFLTSMVNDYGNYLLEKISEDVRSYFVAKGGALEALQFRVRRIISSYEAERESMKVRRDFDTGLQMASFVQRSLLPPWVDVNRAFTYGVAWNPLEKVSGDLYEMVQLNESCALMIFGDVAGHGIRSALAMAAIQSFLKGFAGMDVRRAESVHRVARSIHEFINSNLHDIIYMVGLVVFVDFAARRMRFINAGMPEIKCARGTTGELVVLNPDGRGAMPFGLISDAAYTEDDVVEVSFEDDAVFFIATDGITDSTIDDEGHEFVSDAELSQLCSIAAQSDYANGTIGQTAALVMKSLRDIGYSHVHDDCMIFTFCKSVRRNDRIVHEVEIRPDAIDQMAEVVGMCAGELSGDTELSAKVQLLLDEFLMNVYRHGLDDYGRSTEYGVVMGMMVGDHFELTVWERGQNWDALSGMTLEDTQQKLDERNQILADSGRGTSIMRIIAEGGVSHERIFNVNKTVFRIPVGKGSK